MQVLKHIPHIDIFQVRVGDLIEVAVGFRQNAKPSALAFDRIDAQLQVVERTGIIVQVLDRGLQPVFQCFGQR